MKHLLIFSILIFCAETWSLAQISEKDPFERMNKAYEAKMQRMEQDYAQKTERMQKEYESRMKKMNAAFENYLKKGFSEVEQNEETVKKVEVPKPIDQPVFVPTPIDKANLPSKSLKTSQTQAPKILLEEAPAYSISPIIASPQGMSTYKQALTVDFFGSKAKLYIDHRTSQLQLSEVKPKAFANYWNEFTATYFQIYLESMLHYAQETNLNDWGIYQLMDQTSKQLFSSDNDRDMWKWAMLNQAGYQAKIGYSGNTVCLMLPFMQQVFEKPYYSISGNNYYLIDDQINTRLYTYEDNFGGASKKIDLNLPYSLNLTSESNSVTKSTRLPNEKDALQLHMDQTIMAFLASYPQTDNTVYLNAAMSGSIKDDLYEYIKPRIDGMSEKDAVTYLLNYLHHSFEYKTDRDQFGKEKMFFPDEIFYYPYSDCEDRTVLFTRLVNDLLGLDVVALTYFSHMAAAVSFTQPIDGYNFDVAGKTYTICDPTYINAPIGAVMPEYEGYKPLAIKINNHNQLGNIWQMIAKSIDKNNEGRIFINDRQMSENGKYIVSGWFSDQVTIGDKSYQAASETRDLWFASFGENGSMEWFLPVQSSDYSYTQAFNVGKQGNIYALINYAGSLHINQRKLCQSETPAHLILGLSNQAQPIITENIDFEVPDGKNWPSMVNIVLTEPRWTYSPSPSIRFVLHLK